MWWVGDLYAGTKVDEWLEELLHIPVVEAPGKFVHFEYIIGG